jgi:hypothetical protein
VFGRCSGNRFFFFFGWNPRNLSEIYPKQSQKWENAKKWAIILINKQKPKKRHLCRFCSVNNLFIQRDA